MAMTLEERREYQRKYYAANPSRRTSPEYQKKYYTERLRLIRSTPEYKAKEAARQRKRNATPEGKAKTRAQKLRREYDITPEEWDQLFEAQGRLCAICKSSEPGCPRGWSTDHCHDTERVRGILCPRCNKGLGLFRDSVESLKTAISYLITHKEK
jgi:hypothetical protein